MMSSNEILGLVPLHKYNLAHKLIVTSFCYFMLWLPAVVIRKVSSSVAAREYQVLIQT